MNYNSILQEIQDVEKTFQKQINALKLENQKLKRIIDYLQDTVEQMKKMLFDKQSQINRQQYQIGQYKMIANINLDKLKVQESSRIKTEVLKHDISNLKIEIKPLESLIKKFDQSSMAGSSIIQNKLRCSSHHQIRRNKIY
ncbi:hypothetical protein pb186bvf_016285 [Paramecium bursaria]